MILHTDSTAILGQKIGRLMIEFKNVERANGGLDAELALRCSWSKNCPLERCEPRAARFEDAQVRLFRDPLR